MSNDLSDLVAGVGHFVLTVVVNHSATAEELLKEYKACESPDYISYVRPAIVPLWPRDLTAPYNRVLPKANMRHDTSILFISLPRVPVVSTCPRPAFLSLYPLLSHLTHCTRLIPCQAQSLLVIYSLNFYW